MTADSTREPATRPTGISPDVKVLAAVAALVMLLVIAIALAIIFIITLGTGANSAERQARYATATDAAALWAKSIANHERGFLISGDAEFLVEIEGHTELARTAFDAAADAASQDQRATIAEAREGFERWIDTLDSELATYQAGDTEAAIETSLGPSRTLRKAYEGWLADAKALGHDAFQDATASVSSASTFSVIVLVAYLVLAVAVAIVIALWVVRTVLRPAYALVHLLKDADERSTPA